MSQYQGDYFFSDDEREQSYPMLDSPLIAQKNLYEYEFLDSRLYEKQLHSTYAYNDPTELDQTFQIKVQKTEQKNFRKQKRIKRVIHVNQEKKNKRKQIFKGLKDDTTELNINFKTIILKKLKQLSMLKQLGTQQKTFINQFSKGVASFIEIKKLCKSKNIKQKGLNFIKSTGITHQIIQGNSKWENKMTMLKYIQGLKQNFEFQKITKWKDIYFE